MRGYKSYLMCINNLEIKRPYNFILISNITRNLKSKFWLVSCKFRKPNKVVAIIFLKRKLELK